MAERVRRLRIARGLTLREAEAATAVSRSMLSKIERGLASPLLEATYVHLQARDARLAREGAA